MTKRWYYFCHFIFLSFQFSTDCPNRHGLRHFQERSAFCTVAEIVCWKGLLVNLLVWLLLLAVSGAEAGAEDLPLHRDDLAVLRKIVQREGLDGPPVVNPATGWPRFPGVNMVRFSANERPGHVLAAGLDEQGRVTHLAGNGPLLSNEAFGWIAALPELRVVRIDHNIPSPGSSAPHDDYDGAGIEALVNSKIQDFRITGAFADPGMKHLARIRSLQSIDIFHTRVTDEGIAHLEHHPHLQDVRFAPMGSLRVTNRTLRTLATLPKIKRIGLDETFVTYDDGFEHLKPLKGQLVFVGLKLSLVLPADIEKLKADHPGIEVITSTPAEIGESQYIRNQLLRWASLEAIEFLKKETTP
jgi:hypothetical protein